MAELMTRIILRNDKSTNWNATPDAVLLRGELGIEFLQNSEGVETGKIKVKIGNGGKWSETPYWGGQDSHVFETSVLDAGSNHNTAINALTTGIELTVGDIAIVKEKIGSTNKTSYTAYTWNGTAWAVMDGNVSADNVFFSSDLMTTTAMGNISLTNGQATISAAGKNLVDVFNTIYVKEDSANLQETQPSASLSGSVKYFEIGTTGSQTVTLSLSEDGKYKYGYTTDELEEGEVATNVTADGVTGVTATGYSLTFDGKTVDPSSTGGNSYVLAPSARTEKASLSASGVVTVSDGYIPVSNLKKAYPAQRFGGNKEDGKYTFSASGERFRWYVPFYQGFTYSDTAIADPANITATQLTTSLGAPAAKTADGKVTSSSTAVKNVDGNAYDKKKCTAAAAPKAWRQYFLAYPKSYSYDMSAAKDSNGIDCTVKQAADVTLNINGTDVVYAVYYINNAADYGTLGITWTLN